MTDKASPLVRLCSKKKYKKANKVISRSVTSCAGMTAFMVIIAQTRIGFLTGPRTEVSKTA